MTIYEIKTERQKTYFLRLWRSGVWAHGYKLFQDQGKWSVKPGRYDASDFKNFPDKYKVVCDLNINELRKPMLRAIVDAKYNNKEEPVNE